MKVLLVSPAFGYRAKPQPLLSVSDFPAGIAYVASSLKESGHEVIGLNPNNAPGFDKPYYMLTQKLSEAIETHKPELIGFGGIVTDYQFLKDAIELCRKFAPKTPVVLGGGIISNDREFIFENLHPDYGIVGEGEETMVHLIKVLEWGHGITNVFNLSHWHEGKAVHNEINHNEYRSVDNRPFPDYEVFGVQDMLDNYSMATRLLYRYSRPYPRPFTIVTARGCPFNCLQGDTLIDTLEGQIAIKHLVGRTDVKVLTRSPGTQRVEYAAASIIAKTGLDKELVRVHFDTGTYIDCTPDHRFLGFKNGSRNPHEREIEAKDLQPGQSVRAVKYRVHPIFGYVDVSYGRRFRAKQQRLVMEGYLGRPLDQQEHVHHKDRNKANNVIGNLQLVNVHDHMPLHHPEVAKRMRENNPMRMPDVKARQAATLRVSIARGSVTPFMCTPEGRAMMSRINREISLSEDNHAKQHARKVRASMEVNHKVTWVEMLPQREDVYCLEVPGYDWFFANGVLVHNCTFCIHRGGPKYRARSIENIMEELRVNYERYKFNVLIILDELFAVNKQRMREFCEAVLEGKERYGWDFDWMFQTHASAALDLETLQLAKRAGCFFFSYGIESASPIVLESMNKKAKVPQFIEAIRLAHEAGVGFGGNLIFGDVAETQKTIYESLSFYRQYCNAAFVFLGFLMPYPGNKLFDTCMEQGMIKDKADYYANLDNGLPNMTHMPNELWSQWINYLALEERSWLGTKATTASKIEKETYEDSVTRWRKAAMYRIEAECPYCGKALVYREMIGRRPVDWPVFMGVGCQHCGRRIKIDLAAPAASAVQEEKKEAVTV